MKQSAALSSKNASVNCLSSEKSTTTNTTATANISFISLGLALFSMFFGGGNLIFPLVLGKASMSHWLYGGMGLILTGVVLPFLGVISMIRFQGQVSTFMNILGKWPGGIFIFLLLTFWIPLGSSPRCITLSYEGLKLLTDQLPLWAFGPVLCGLTYWLSLKKGRMLEVLGKYLTPILLILLGTIITVGLLQPSSPSDAVADSNNGASTFIMGVLQGYNTMDLIASFFFSSSIIHYFFRPEKQSFQQSKQQLFLVFKAFLFGAVLLGILYLFMVKIASSSAHLLEGIANEKLLLHLALEFLGPRWGLLASLVASLACFTTLVALTSVYSEYLCATIFKGRLKQKYCTLIVLVPTYIVSLTGLSGVTALTAPALSIFYPILLILILIQLYRSR